MRVGVVKLFFEVLHVPSQQKKEGLLERVTSTQPNDHPAGHLHCEHDNEIVILHERSSNHRAGPPLVGPGLY